MEAITALGVVGVIVTVILWVASRQNKRFDRLDDRAGQLEKDHAEVKAKMEGIQREVGAASSQMSAFVGQLLGQVAAVPRKRGWFSRG